MTLQITVDPEIISTSWQVSEQMSALGIYSVSINIDIHIAAKSVLIVASLSNSQPVALLIQSCRHALAQEIISPPKALQQ